MIQTAETLEYLRRGRATARFHTVRMFDYQRIDAHSYGVAQLVRFLLGPDVDPVRLARLLCAALDHDLPEHVTGDIPAPTKRALPDAGQESLELMEFGVAQEYGMAGFIRLSEEDRTILKIADAAEGCLHCIEERRVGNRNVVEAFRNFWSYLEKLSFRDVSEPLYGHLVTEWRSVNGGDW